MDERLQNRLAQLELQERLKRGNKAIIEQFKSECPNLAKRVDCRMDYLVWNKRPKGSSKIIPSLVKIMCDPLNLEKTQDQLIHEVSKLHPEHKITKHVWTKALQKYDKENIVKQLEELGITDDLVKGCKKLSELRNKINLEHHIQSEKPRHFKATVSINKNKVTIGRKVFPVFWKKSKGKKYPCINVTVKSKKCSIRVDALAVALHAGEKS